MSISGRNIEKNCNYKMKFYFFSLTGVNLKTLEELRGFKVITVILKF